MFQILRNTLLLTAVTTLMIASEQNAMATDRFDVVVEIVTFKSLIDMDPSNATDEYFLTVNADVPNSRSRSIQMSRLDGAPMKVLRVGRTLVFKNINEPSRSNRTIKLTSDVSEQDVITTGSLLKKKKKTVYADMGTASQSITDDLFREADRSSSDTASKTVTLSNRKYRMVIRVTVIEVD